MKDCNQCGKCCTKYANGGLSASTTELEYWEVFRPDISEYVLNGDIWTNPNTGEKIEQCPWLRKSPNQEKYFCDIYNDRPNDCKYYPVTIEQMISDECEMLESKDLEKPKQAQKTLDKLMANSRPAYE